MSTLIKENSEGDEPDYVLVENDQYSNAWVRVGDMVMEFHKVGEGIRICVMRENHEDFLDYILDVVVLANGDVTLHTTQKEN